jgi:hypothetical protein
MRVPWEIYIYIYSRALRTQIYLAEREYISLRTMGLWSDAAVRTGDMLYVPYLIHCTFPSGNR